MFTFTRISPLPNPLNSGNPLACNLNIFPGDVPAGIFILKVDPFRLGKSTSKPRQASLNVRYLLCIRFVPSLTYTGWTYSSMFTIRSPGFEGDLAQSPLPTTRYETQVIDPFGILTSNSSSFLAVPAPEHSRQYDFAIAPTPLHDLHVSCITTSPKT